jgi:hypothetical protein
METDGRGLSMDENKPAGDSMVINHYMSVGLFSLNDLTTIIRVASNTLKTQIF